MIHLRSRKRVKDRKGHKMAAACIYKPIKHPNPHRATGYIGWLHNARAHGTKVFAHTESNKVMGTRQNHISEACLPEVHESYFPRDDNTLISHAPLKLFLEWCHWGLTETADCWLLSFPRQRHFGLTHFWYMLMHWELLWQKGEANSGFLEYMWYVSQAKKRSIVCSSIVTFQAAMSFLSFQVYVAISVV